MLCQVRILVYENFVNDHQQPFSGDGSDAFEDEYTEGVLATFEGEDMSSSVKRIGRGEGLYDVAGLKICGQTDPCDVIQGNIGNCWLMSSFSAVAEFDGEFLKVLRMTSRQAVRCHSNDV